MKSVLGTFAIALCSSSLFAQDLLETIKKSEFVTFQIDDATYSEVTAKAILPDGNIIIGGFNRGEDNQRMSVLFLYDAEGATLKNGYDKDYLGYNLYEGRENFINDIVPYTDGGAYVLGSSDLGDFYTGYLVKVDKRVTIDDDLMVAGTEDTGFVRIHNYSMVEPNTQDKFQVLKDTTYCEPQNIFVQKDGKLLIVGATRKQMTDDNYEDGESFIMRIFPDGTLDKSYGVQGIAHINPSEKCDDVRTAIMLQDGSVVMYGQYNHAYKSGGTTQFPQSYITKVDKFGKIDRSFGNNGIYVFEMDSTVTNPVAIIEQRDKSLLFFSNRMKQTSKEQYFYGMAVLKLKKDGSVDRRFQDNGVAIITKMGIGFTTDVLQTNDGKILICGTNQNLIKDQNEDAETLYRSEGYVEDPQNYSEEEQEEQAAIGFSMRLNEDGSVDKSYPKNGTFFTRKNDMRQKIYFSKIIPITATELLVFGAATPESNSDVIAFMKLNLTTKLDFGKMTPQNEVAMSFYPNPVKDKATIDFELTETDNLSAVLVDIKGRLVQTFFQNKSFGKGHHQESIIINSGIPAGMYIMNLRGKNVSKSIKVIVQ